MTTDVENAGAAVPALVGLSSSSPSPSSPATCIYEKERNNKRAREEGRAIALFKSFPTEFPLPPPPPCRIITLRRRGAEHQTTRQSFQRSDGGLSCTVGVCVCVFFSIDHHIDGQQLQSGRFSCPPPKVVVVMGTASGWKPVATITFNNRSQTGREGVALKYAWTGDQQHKWRIIDREKGQHNRQPRRYTPPPPALNGSSAIIGPIMPLTSPFIEPIPAARYCDSHFL